MSSARGRTLAASQAKMTRTTRCGLLEPQRIGLRVTSIFALYASVPVVGRMPVIANGLSERTTYTFHPNMGGRTLIHGSGCALTMDAPLPTIGGLSRTASLSRTEWKPAFRHQRAPVAHDTPSCAVQSF